MIYGGHTCFSCSPPYSHFSSLLLHLSLPPPSSFPPPAAKKIQLAKVTFSYAAENPDELDLQPGQVRTLPPLNPHSFHPHSCILTHSPSLISPSLTHLTHHTLTHHTSHSHSPITPSSSQLLLHPCSLHSHPLHPHPSSLFTPCSDHTLTVYAHTHHILTLSTMQEFVVQYIC